jgi:predicted transcriptional regulator
MSTSALNGLRDYLIGTLSKEEINDMLEQSVRDFEKGRYFTNEEVMREWDEEMERAEKEEFEMA